MSEVPRSVKTGPGLTVFPGVSLGVCKPKGDVTRGKVAGSPRDVPRRLCNPQSWGSCWWGWAGSRTVARSGRRAFWFPPEEGFEASYLCLATQHGWGGGGAWASH